jgi:hypothetical protein
VRQVIFVVAVGAIASILAVILWEMGGECVRWSTRVDANRTGTYLTEVCAELVPRRDAPKTKWRSSQQPNRAAWCLSQSSWAKHRTKW